MASKNPITGNNIRTVQNFAAVVSPNHTNPKTLITQGRDGSMGVEILARIKGEAHKAISIRMFPAGEKLLLAIYDETTAGKSRHIETIEVER